MRYCPSDDWEAHLASTELPEECPQCKGENFDADKDEWLCRDAIGFCSIECKKDFDDEEAYQFASASCVKHREQIYVAEGCGKCETEEFEEYQREFYEAE